MEPLGKSFALAGLTVLRALSKIDTYFAGHNFHPKQATINAFPVPCTGVISVSRVVPLPLHISLQQQHVMHSHSVVVDIQALGPSCSDSDVDRQ